MYRFDERLRVSACCPSGDGAHRLVHGRGATLGQCVWNMVLSVPFNMLEMSTYNMILPIRYVGNKQHVQHDLCSRFDTTLESKQHGEL